MRISSEAIGAEALWSDVVEPLDPMTPISVVICTLGLRPSLESTLRAAAAQLRDGDELMVVLNGRAVLPETVTAPGVRVVTEPRLGISAARGRAIDEARNDVILFTDDDCVPQPGWADALRAAMGQADAAGGVVRVIWPEEEPRWLHPKLRPMFGALAPADLRREPFGANMAVRRRAVLSVGGFRTDLGHRGRQLRLHEETELFWRFASVGFEVVAVPAAVVHHHVPAQLVRRRWVMRRAFAEGRSDAAADPTRPLAVHRRLGELLLRLGGAWASRDARYALFAAARGGVHAGFVWQRCVVRYWERAKPRDFSFW